MLIFLELEHVLDATELHCAQVLPRSLRLHSELAHMFPVELHVAREMLTFFEQELVFDAAELHVHGRC